MRDYIYTDLACENDKNFTNIRFKEEKHPQNIKNKCKIIELNIQTKEDEQRYGRGRGRYVTIMTPYLCALDEDTYFRIKYRLSNEIRKMMSVYLRARSCLHSSSVLVVGLGNAEITADALGPETVKQITVTRHLMPKKTIRPVKDSSLSVCSMIPGVLGSTGIETVESVLGAVERIKPDLILAVDALSARHISRLASTIQVTDAGIAPGSGIGNDQKSLTAEVLGVPVIAIGVPMVVNSSTMIRDVLEQGGIPSVSEQMRAILENGKSFFVTPKESDVILKSVSMLLAEAIDLALSYGGNT
ncbi:MAG: GPR endopeptidase [Ruminococcaceae bacterium]|nr:GPR endopeptidase [Oscillospiraceae bacterium]